MTVRPWANGLIAAHRATMLAAAFVTLHCLPVEPARHCRPRLQQCQRSSRTNASLVSSTTSLPQVSHEGISSRLAYSCILYVHPTLTLFSSVALLDSIRPYLVFQSNLQWIKDPPDDFAKKIQEPYDFMAEFERIYAKAKAQGYADATYANEYEFGFDVYRAFQKSHDGHFGVYPDSVGYIFHFFRTTPLVSVSEDGEEVPQVYAFSDVLECTAGNGTYTPSPITHIDGRDSHEFLLEWSQYGSLQDRDALWNNMFYLLSQVSIGKKGSGLGTFAGGGRGRFIYPGASTTLTFENGTEIVNENFARVLQEFNNITSPADIYTTFFAVREGDVQNAYQIGVVTSSTSSTSTSTSSSTSSTSSTATATPVPAPGFPTPVVRHPKNFNGGYYLEDEGYQDVAVLSVPNFIGSKQDEMPFQAVNTYFLERAVNGQQHRCFWFGRIH